MARAYDRPTTTEKKPLEKKSKNWGSRLRAKTDSTPASGFNEYKNRKRKNTRAPTTLRGVGGQKEYWLATFFLTALLRKYRSEESCIR